MKLRLACVLLLLVAAPLPGRADSSRRHQVVDFTRYEHLRSITKGYSHSLSAGGHAFAVFDQNVVRLIDTRDEKEFQTLVGHAAMVHDAGWSRDGRFLATTGFDAQVRVWEVASGRSEFKIMPHAGYACSVAFSPDGKVLATGGSQDGLIKLFDASNGREIRVIRTGDVSVFNLVFTPDGKHLVAYHSLTNRGDDSLRVLKTSDGSDVRGLSSGAITAFALSGDGRTLAYSNAHGAVILVETTSWTEVRRLEGHSTGATSIAFQPVSRYLATAGRDGAVRLWDGDTGKLLRALPIKEETEARMAFASDGLSLAVALNDATVQMFGQTEPRARISDASRGNAAKPEPAPPPGK